ncbi:MAG: hypothetical protein KA141_10290 [Rubrivivax sp.]|nr:hypothetical protein [Rubrivivax sp.]
MRRHSELGHTLLQQSKDLDPIALDVCLRHHEKPVGSGYPGSMSDGQVSLHAKMGTVCDVYDALTSDPPYRPGCNLPVALLRLKSGRLAAVVEQNPSSLLTPLVNAFCSTRSDLHIEPRLIDLSHPQCQDAVQSCEDLKDWNFTQLQRLWADEAGLAA